MRSATAGRDRAQRPRGGSEQARQRGREAADPHLSARRGVLRGEVALELLQLREQRVGVAEQHVRRGREAHAAARGFEQRVADLAFERGQLLRDRRRREMQRIRGRGERAVVGHRSQRPQSSQVDHEDDLTGQLHKVQSLLSVRTVTVVGMPRRHVLLALAVAVIWGVNFVVIHVGLDHFPPLLFAALRFCLVALALPFVPRPGVPVKYVIAVGVFLSAGQFGLLFLGIEKGMPAGLASLVLQLQAAFTVGLAVLLLRSARGPRSSRAVRSPSPGSGSSPPAAPRPSRSGRSR